MEPITISEFNEVLDKAINIGDDKEINNYIDSIFKKNPGIRLHYSDVKDLIMSLSYLGDVKGIHNTIDMSMGVIYMLFSNRIEQLEYRLEMLKKSIQKEGLN